MPLPLAPSSGEWAQDAFPKPYAPGSAHDTHQDVTLRVLAVAHSPQETALRLQLEWANPDWETHFITGDSPPRLQDDLGHIYRDVIPSDGSGSPQAVVVAVPEQTSATPTPIPVVPTLEWTMTFAPVSPAAQQLTFTMDGLRFRIPAQADFEVDLGPHPKTGDRWSLDVRLQVAGFPVHVTGARLIEERIGPGRDARRRQVLQFEFDPVPDQGNQGLRGIGLRSEAAGFREGGTGGYTYGTRKIRAGLVVQEGAAIPTGVISVTVQTAGILVHGPFTTTWAMPVASEW